MRILIKGNQRFGAAVLQEFYNRTDHDVIGILCEKDFIEKPIDPIKKYAEQYMEKIRNIIHQRIIKNFNSEVF